MFIIKGKAKRKFQQNINGIKDFKATNIPKKVVLVNKQFHDDFVNWLTHLRSPAPENLNTDIFYTENKIKSDLKRGIDFEIISCYLWNDLVKFFGPQPKIDAILIKNPKDGEEMVLLLHENCIEFNIYYPKKVASTDLYSISMIPIQYYSHPDWHLEDVKQQICLNYGLNSSQFQFAQHNQTVNQYSRINEKLKMSQVSAQYKNDLDLRQNKLNQLNSSNRDKMVSLKLHRNPSNSSSISALYNLYTQKVPQEQNFRATEGTSPLSQKVPQEKNFRAEGTSPLSQKVLQEQYFRAEGTSPLSQKVLQEQNFRAEGTSLLPKPIGFNNIGNTCYFNAAMQCLIRVMPLTSFILSDNFTSQLNPSNPRSSHGRIAHAYRRFLEDLSRYPTTTPRTPNDLRLAFVSTFRAFDNYSQHDSQELLISILDGLHEDMNQSAHVNGHQPPITITRESDSWDINRSRNSSPIVDIFYGILFSSITCPSCGFIEKLREPFVFLSLDVPRRFGPVKLQSCLSRFARTESLDWRNKWHCEKCGKKVCAKKETGVERCGGKALIIHLKRFSGEGLFALKIETTVDYPDVLDAASFTKSDTGRFRLVGAVFHFGGLGGGHYTAAAIDPASGEWYSFNDSVARRIGRSEAHNRAAYILFYERCE